MARVIISGRLQQIAIGIPEVDRGDRPRGSSGWLWTNFQSNSEVRRRANIPEDTAGHDEAQIRRPGSGPGRMRSDGLTAECRLIFLLPKDQGLSLVIKGNFLHAQYP